MSRTLTWEYLSPIHVNRAQTALDAATVHRVLEEADAESRAGYFADLSPTQTQILLDLFYHVLRFAKAQNLTAEKVSTLVSIIYRTHTDSMNNRASMSESYAIFQSYIIAHAVHRPPYSSAVFAVDDVKHINDYFLSTYYRHYKLYYFAFTKRSEATVKSVLLGSVNECPPIPIPLAKAVPLAVWEAHQAELQRLREEELRRQQEAAAAAAEAARKQAEEEQTAMSAGLKQQLDIIKAAVAKTSSEKIEALEAKIQQLEAKIAEQNKPTSAVTGKPPPKAGQRK